MIPGKYDIISDASPSIGQVTKGARVCLRTSVEFSEEVEQPGMYAEAFPEVAQTCRRNSEHFGSPGIEHKFSRFKIVSRNTVNL